MIKKIFAVMTIFIVILSACPQVFAEPVDIEFARNAGKSFIESEITAGDYTSDDYVRKTRSREILDFFSPESEVSKVTPVYNDDGTGDISAYVLELEPAGYVVISTDTDIHPLIAYSYSGTFPFEESDDNTVLHLVKWDMEKRIEAIPSMSEEKLTENRSRWTEIKQSSLKREKRSSVTTWGPWMTTAWHQESPYNRYVPVDSYSQNQRAVVGCVATAMAQIIYYWNYPESVSFSSSDSYTTDSRRIKIDSDYQKYDFPSFTQLNSMLSDIQYNGGEDEIAALCFAAGISVEMDYTYSAGSGAYVSDVYNAFKNKFDYSSANYSGGWSGINYTTLKSNMQDKKPALLGISKSNGRDGHAIVADGYKSSGEYHLNFGWGSAGSDAWYFLPSGMPEGFSVVDEAILDIYPPTTTPITEETLTSVSITGSSDISGGNYSDYTATAYFSDGTSQDVTSSVTWSDNSSYAYFDSSVKGRLKTNSVTSAKSVTITAAYTYNSVTKSGTKAITVTPSGKTLTSVSISGSSSIIGGNYADYTATAYFSDGTSQDVTSSATWSENSSYAYFDSSVKGRLKTNSVTSTKSVTITASYTYNGVKKSSTKSVTVTSSASSGATLKIINNYYIAQEIYLDNVYLGKVSAYKTGTWSISTGYHTVSACDPGKINCLYEYDYAAAGVPWELEIYSRSRSSNDKSVRKTTDTEVSR